MNSCCGCVRGQIEACVMPIFDMCDIGLEIRSKIPKIRRLMSGQIFGGLSRWVRYVPIGIQLDPVHSFRPCVEIQGPCTLHPYYSIYSNATGSPRCAA